MRSDFSYFSRILRQCCHVSGSPRLIAAKESIASVETSRSGVFCDYWLKFTQEQQGQLDRDAAR